MGMSQDLLRSRRLSGTTTALFAATTKQTLQFPTELASKKVLIQDISVTHEAGAAVSFQPRLFETSAAAAEDIEQRYLASSTLVSLQVHDQPNVTITLDADARAYLTPGPNAAADNQFKYVVEWAECYPGVA